MEAAIVLFVAVTLAIGIRTYVKIRGQATNYYLAGNTMPAWVIGITLCAQAFDANGSVGNASLSFSGGFWAGAVIPIGLAACLFLTGLFFAKPIHRMHLMTLPDFYRRRYGGTTETLAALSMLVSNIVLVAGNLAGLGLVFHRVFGGGYLPMLVVIAICILAYAVTGGLYATITTSVFQVSIFVIGMLVGIGWLVGTHGWTSMMSQVPVRFVDLSGLLDPGNRAFLNWASLASLALGDVVAIDFMQRVISARSGESAQKGCYAAGFLTLGVGLSVSFVGLFAFYFQKEPGPYLLIDIAVDNMPLAVGTLILLGVIAASMSTAAGVVLDLANLITRNLIQRYARASWNDSRMLGVSRLIAIPTMAASVLFAYLRPEPGVLLILAFDIVLAGCFVPLALGIYWKRSNTAGAVASILAGGGLRLALYYLIPTDYAGFDTLIPPVVSLIVFIVVSVLTQERFEPNHEALSHRPTDDELVKGTF